MTNPRHLILYHGNCADGFLAATITRHAILQDDPLATILMTPCSYDKPAKTEETLAGATNHDFVYMVDFSFHRHTLDAVAKRCQRLVVLDHHQTAAHLADARYATIDEHYSGCQLAWHYFFPGQPQPDLVRLVAWRDLGSQWKHPNDHASRLSARVHIGLMQLTPRTPEAWQTVMFDASAYEDLVTAAGGCQRISADLAAHHAAAAQLLFLQADDGQWLALPAISHPPELLTSDALHHVAKSPHPPIPIQLLARPEPRPTWVEGVAAAWWITEAGTRFSVRSVASSPTNALSLAQRFAGGGGHTHAAGFTTTNLFTLPV